MAKSKGRVENLKPKTSPQARGKLGGKKSVAVRKEKKLLSMIYADILADQAGIKKGKGFQGVAEEILNNPDPKNNSSRVALMREIREATEGSKVKTEGSININTDDTAIKEILAEYGISKPKD